MAIDATTIDSSAVQRTAPREKASPVINDGHNGGPVEIRGEMSFWDFLDVINPLQHIPIVSTVYREITGDTIQPSMRVMGDMLYGGVVGGMASLANAVIEEGTGSDIGDKVMASLGFGGGDRPADSIDVADAPGGPAPSAATPAAASGQAPAGPPPAGGLAAALAAARPTSLQPPAPATGQPVRLAAAQEPPALAAQLAAGGTGAPHPGKMPARDTPLASSALAKHSVPRQVAPTTGTVMAAARAAGAAPADGIPGGTQGTPPGTPPDSAAAAAAKAPPGEAGPQPVAPAMLSETMMRNLAKYEQSRKAAQAASTTRLSG
ncbi:hypothetical protein ABMY26_15175 [Azospirillum sp. HJ39]|uniref:hypothetical protein n=1 Tax=Azospirillum sp. HJ39 TaxID=3159496 RepID=UPI003555F59F